MIDKILNHLRGKGRRRGRLPWATGPPGRPRRRVSAQTARGRSQSPLATGRRRWAVVDAAETDDAVWEPGRSGLGGRGERRRRGRGRGARGRGRDSAGVERQVHGAGV